MKNTPPLRARGRYVLASPWVANPAKLYTTVAIRGFEDLFTLGIDVYNTYYLPMGLIDGQSGFSFSAEQANKADIITLQSDDGEVIYVPDTYIQSYPNMGEVKYSHVVLSISLGPLPDQNDLTNVKAVLADQVAQVYGITPTVVEHRAASTSNPSATEHEALEAARVAAITVLETDHAKALRFQAQNVLLNQKIVALTNLLKAHHIPPFNQ